MSKAVVVASGGMDSTILLFFARIRHEEVHAIAFRYGQQNMHELSCLEYICNKYQFPLTIIDLDFLSAITNSPLITGEHEKDIFDPYVPNRNALFITLAHTYAHLIQAEKVFVGFTFIGCIDAKPKLLVPLNKALNLKDKDYTVRQIPIEAPFNDLGKEILYAYAYEYGILDDIIEHSYGCYTGSQKANDWGIGCGVCMTCIDRASSFKMFREAYEPYIKKETPQFINNTIC